jgi:hypothetical protein
MTTIKKFTDAFEIFVYTSDIRCLHEEYELCSEFIAMYMQCNLDENQKKQMIAEYGMKRLIDLQCSYEGTSICEELLNFEEHMDTWVHTMLMNIATLV